MIFELLAADNKQTFNKDSELQQMEYLKLTREFQIIDASLDVQRFTDYPDEVMLGADVRVGFPELIGIEEIMLDILEDRKQQFDLEGIIRFLENRTPLYFDLCIRRFNNRLFLFFEEVTKEMLWQQTLLQENHERSLLLQHLTAFKKQIE